MHEKHITHFGGFFTNGVAEKEYFAASGKLLWTKLIDQVDYGNQASLMIGGPETAAGEGALGITARTVLTAEARTLPRFGVRSATARAVDFLPGETYGGHVLTAKQLDAFEKRLAKHDIILRRDVDVSSTLLDGTPRLGGSAFTPDDIFAGKPAVYLPPNPTVRQLTHEWIHAMDYIENPMTYLSRPGGTVLREQIVFDRMIKPGVWSQLKEAERARTIRVIEGYGGTSRGMKVSE